MFVFDLITLQKPVVQLRLPGEILSAAVTSLPVHGKCFISDCMRQVTGPPVY